MLGLMMDTPLLTTDILRYAATAHGETEIVSRNVDGRQTYKGERYVRKTSWIDLRHIVDRLECRRRRREEVWTGRD